MMFNPFSILTSKIFCAALLAALMVVGLQSCQLDRARDKIATMKAAEKQWAKAHETNLDSIATLTAALADQSARVRALGEASAQRQVAAQDALRRAVERNKASEAVAVRIERVVPVGCKTGAEIMDSRDQL